MGSLRKAHFVHVWGKVPGARPKGRFKGYKCVGEYEIPSPMRSGTLGDRTSAMKVQCPNPTISPSTYAMNKRPVRLYLRIKRGSGVTKPGIVAAPGPTTFGPSIA